MGKMHDLTMRLTRLNASVTHAAVRRDLSLRRPDDPRHHQPPGAPLLTTGLGHTIAKSARERGGKFSSDTVCLEMFRVALEPCSSTPQAGKLLLHWGVEGGKNYKGGWRLPDRRPEGTVQYKDRALQTPWRCVGVWVCGR